MKLRKLYESFVSRELEIFLAQKGKCFYCGEEMDSVKHPASHRGYTIDHLYPKCKGNSLKNNKVLCHFRCNKKKGKRAPKDCEINKHRDIIKRMVIRRRRIFK